MPPTAVSAPGKVFLAGGYLVLDRAYTALVFGLSARIHVVVRDVETTTTNSTSSRPDLDLDLAEIVVQSPQFRDAVWTYAYRQLGQGDGGVEVKQLQGSTSAPHSRNPFVETALQYALTYISTVLPSSSPLKPTSITILADDDYYSQPSSTTTSPSRFTDFNVRLTDAHKTGLGSSAALVTAFTAALLTHYLPSSSFKLNTPAGQQKLHNLAQISHCAAQGKIGSGFDIATAVYGTCVYRRFSPSILSSLSEPGSDGFARRVDLLVENSDADLKWDTEISKGVKLPGGYALVMCDVDCGSETVGMVKGVLGWRKTDPEGSKVLMDELQVWNSALAEGLKGTDVGVLGNAFQEIRKRIRDMGDRSGVPIEPKEQTELLDALTEGVGGVVGGVVPGAGGYDAVVLLVKDDEETTRDINTFLEKWSKEKSSNVKLLKTKGELEGARVEEGASYVEYTK